MLEKNKLKFIGYGNQTVTQWFKKGHMVSGRGGEQEGEVLTGAEVVSKEVRVGCRVECWGPSQRCWCLRSETAS